MFRKLCVALFATVSVAALSPAEIGDIIRQKQKKASTMVKIEDLPSVCGAVECADIVDKCALEIVWNEGQCCPVCSTPGYSTERVDADLGFRAMQSTVADAALCRETRCFALVCEPGKKPTARPGGCCNECA